MFARFWSLCLCLCLLAGALVPAASAAEVVEKDFGFLVEDDYGYQAPMGMSRQALVYGEGRDTYGDFTTRPTAACEVLRKGIDVSEYNGKIDWNAVKNSGVEFAIIRGASRGWGGAGRLMKDSSFAENVQGAKAAGLHVGAYIFSQAITLDEARAEAQLLLEVVGENKLDLPLVLDFEYAGTAQGRLYHANLSRRAATDICNAFCQAVEAAGFDSMVYMNLNMAQNQVYAGEIGRLWLAHYSQVCGYDGYMEMWQCSSKGSVPGISGNVDLDFWYDPAGNPDAPPFLDIRLENWYYQVVKDAYDRKVVNGVTERSFAPRAPVQRCQAVTMLYRLMGSPTVSGETDFADAAGTYFEDAVIWAKVGGLVNGFSDTEFGAYSEMRREDLVLVLYRVAGSPAPTEGVLEGFADVADLHNWTVDAMSWAVESGLITGYDDNTLRPRSNITRAETCALLIRFDDMVGIRG